MEDDETLSQFFSMVLDLLPVRGQVCGSAEEALTLLGRQPVDIIVTDLLLPGLGGAGLLQRLKRDPSLGPPPLMVVMSGSIDDVVRRELTAMGVWRVLAKPIAVKAFKACMHEAIEQLQTTADQRAQAGVAVGAGAPQETAASSPQADELTWAAHELEAIRVHFAGDRQLFATYRATCLAQFRVDIATGDAALSQHDTPSLRRVAHNLKTVLRTLGHEQASVVARTLEDLAANPRSYEGLTTVWHDLRRQLIDLQGAR